MEYPGWDCGFAGAVVTAMGGGSMRAPSARSQAGESCEGDTPALLVEHLAPAPLEAGHELSVGPCVYS